MSNGPTQERKPSRTLVGLALLATGVAAYLAGSRARQPNRVPQSPLTGPPAFDPSMIRRAPPARLEAGSIDAFVLWVAGTPASEAQAVRDAVASARADGEAAGALVANLFDLPIRDIGRHQLLLSIIGEMRRPEFLDPLVRFIGLPSGSIVADACDGVGDGPHISHLDAAALLKARAVEMLAYLRTAEALEAVLGIASRHESRVVRLAALDAYTYNHEDSADSLERARAAARRGEARFVGLPRRTRESDPAEFEARVARFYDEYPEERPPQPHTPRIPARERSPSRRVSR